MTIDATTMKEARHINELLSDDERRSVLQRSDLRAGWIVVSQIVGMAAIFVAVAYWTNPLTLILGTILLGGRHLGFGVIVHECGHRTFFKTPWLNLFVGRWIASPLIFNNVDAYMRGHLQHHRLAGTDQDPDLSNYRDYPIAAERFRRKLKRDLTGQTGWRTVQGIFRGLKKFPQLPRESQASLSKAVIANLLLLLVLIYFGEGWLYLMWVGAFIITGPLIARVRQVAEHGAVPNLYDLDPRMNTRTVRANPLWRLVFCPHYVNYHLEHHMLAAVPNYRLKRLHQLLTRKGYYDGVDFPLGYIDLLKRVLTPGHVLAT